MHILRLTMLAAGLVVLAACNGNGNGAPDGADAGDTALSVTATEFAFDPDRSTVPAGEEITLDLVNEGTIEHEWVIIEQGTQIASTAEFEEDMVVWEIEADAGETEMGSFTAPEAGTYQVVCAIDGHLDAGMEGTLEVVE
jgi:plastocyanin